MPFPFITSPFAQLAFRAYDVLWNGVPREEPEHELLQAEHLTALRFYDYIRLHQGEKIDLNVLVEIGISIDEVYFLFMLIYLRQGKDSIYLFTSDNLAYMVYTPERKADE
jgi:hypothetical protein